MNDTSQTRNTKGAAAPIRFKKILAPTDFSPCADQALAYALDLARRHRAAVHLLHVIGPLEGDAYSPLRYAPEARVRQETPDTIAYDLLQTRMSQHDTEGIVVEPVKRHGSAVASTLLHYAKKEGVDLIAMGTHGRHGMQHFVMGSVAERTVRQAPCSVLTVREQPAAANGGQTLEKPQIRRILVPLDFSEPSEALLRAAHALAVAYDAELDLLHVIEPPPFVGLRTGVITASDVLPDVEKWAAEALQHLWEQVGGEGVQARLHVEEGHAAVHIVDFAARRGADLIAIASQGRSGVERFLIGSVTERVVRTASCPVLTFKVLSAEAAPRGAQGEEQPEAQPTTNL